MNRDPVGAQWELRGGWRTQASASATTMPPCAHTSRDVFPPVTALSGSFSNQKRQ